MTAEDVYAIRAGAMAIVAQCNAALARMGQREAMTADEARETDEEAAPCVHVRLIATGAMGSSLRRRCLDCGATIEAAGAVEPVSVNHESERRI